MHDADNKRVAFAFQLYLTNKGHLSKKNFRQQNWMGKRQNEFHIRDSSFIFI